MIQDGLIIEEAYISLVETFNMYLPLKMDLEYFLEKLKKHFPFAEDFSVFQRFLFADSYDSKESYKIIVGILLADLSSLNFTNKAIQFIISSLKK